MIRPPVSLLAAVLSLAVTSAFARDDHRPTQLAQLDKGAVGSPAVGTQKQFADKAGAPAIKGAAVSKPAADRPLPPTAQGKGGPVLDAKKQTAIPGRTSLQAGEHPPGEQGSKGGGGPGQLKAGRGVQMGEHPPGEQGSKGGGGPGQLKAGRGVQMGEHPPGEQGGKGSGGPGQLKAGRGLQMGEHPPGEQGGKGSGGPGQLKSGMKDSAAAKGAMKDIR